MLPDSRASAPKTAIVMTARTTPYSAIVWPSSRCGRSAKSLCSSIVLPPSAAEDDVAPTAPLTRGAGRAATRSPRHSGVKLSRLRDVAGDARDGVHDVAGQQGERPEDGNRDDGQDDAVLGHRLTLLALRQSKQLLHFAFLLRLR